MGMIYNARRAARLARRVKNKLEKHLSVTKDFYFNIDSPRALHLEDKVVEVEGWIIPKSGQSVSVRIKNGTRYYPVEMNLERFDVMKSLGDKYGEKALHSGFRSSFEYEDGEIVVEVNSGRGYKKLVTKKIFYGVDKTPKYYYNPDMAWHYAEHQNLIDSRKTYFYESEMEGSINLSKSDPRLMAIYLPQFHPFPENDKAWGKGFTEWTNVSAGQPRFIGHVQPLLPSTLGFYDLRLEEKIKEQIDLAKKYGISGFAMYYYWFSGKKLMDGPIESIYKHKEWDFNYSICWANENWTKRWDGRDNDVIIAQEYRDEDPLDFIQDVEKFLVDPRYIRYENKPVLTVYRPSHLKNPEQYAKTWREYFKKKHNLELYLVSVLSFDDRDPRDYGFDAAMDFAPLSAFFKNKHFPDGHFPYINTNDKLLDVNFDGVVADYRSIALNKNLVDCYEFNTFPCVTPSWDNDARKKGKGFVYTNSSPKLYAKWLDNVLDVYTKKEDTPIVYINAWNEWAEGAIMEPSQHLGYAVLNETAKTLSKYTKNPQKMTVQKTNKKLAVVVHLYYDDAWDTIASRLNLIQEPYEVFVTLPERNYDIDLASSLPGVEIHKYIVPNRGRDVLPFIRVLQDISAQKYQYLLKIHSKKSQHRADGAVWFDELLAGLIPNAKTVKSIVSTLAKKDTAIIGPAEHIVSLKRHMGSNEAILRHLLTQTYSTKQADKVLDRREMYPYVGGTMFWARVDALEPLLNLGLLPDDFQSEHGQVDGTLAHAIERYLGVIAQMDDRKIYTVTRNGHIECINGNKYSDKYNYAP